MEYGTITGTVTVARGDDISPATGYLRFVPSASVLLDSYGDIYWVVKSVVASLDSQGEFAVDLPSTNIVGVQPVNWTWEVHFFLEGGSPTAPFSFQVESGTAVDLIDLTPVPDTNGTYYLGVTQDDVDATIAVHASTAVAVHGIPDTTLLQLVLQRDEDAGTYPVRPSWPHPILWRGTIAPPVGGSYALENDDWHNTTPIE